MDQCGYPCLETRHGEPMMLEGVRATGEVRGLMLEMSVEQRFRNSIGKNVEIVYSFPLPWGAVLLGIDVQLGDQHLAGSIIEKNQAEVRYEEMLSEGNAAVMLEKNRDCSYSLNLGNLAAGENCVIKLRYAQTLQFEQRGLRLLIPTVIAPRYGDAVTEGGMQPHQAPVHDLLAEYPFDIELSLHGELARAQVASPSHSIGIARSSTGADTILTISLARRGTLDRDFVLVIDQLTQDSAAILARDFVEPEGVVALASFCPHISASDSTAIAVKILVDCSGSMEGDSIQAAKGALQSIIHQLDKGDRFSLSRFGSTVEHRSRGLWAVTETTQLAAQRWVVGLQANLGDTEMEEALRSTFGLAQTVPSDVLIVTDGGISAIDSAVESAKASGHRVFVVGIGSSPAESHLHRLAEATLGACDFVSAGEAVEPAVSRMFARLRSPRLTDLAVVWPGGSKPEWVSCLNAAVFDGDRVNVFAFFSGVSQLPGGDVRLLGTRSAAGVPEEIGCATFAAVLEPDNTLSRLAASVRLQSVETDSLIGVTPEATQLGVAYQLVTDQTSFLLVHQRAGEQKPADMPDFYKVRYMVPAGWGGTGSVTGSVMFSRGGSYLAAGIAEYQSAVSLDWSDVDACGIKVAQNASSFEYRTHADTAALQHKRDHIIDRTKRHYWSGSELTPLGLSEWLRIAPMTEWPKTYIELRQIGLGAWLTDWLELVIGMDTQSLPEKIVVKAFLYVMSQRSIHESLTKSSGLLQGLNLIPKGVKDSFATNLGGRPNVDTLLVEEMVASLDGMTGDTWPDRIYAMEKLRKETRLKEKEAAV